MSSYRPRYAMRFCRWRFRPWLAVVITSATLGLSLATGTISSPAQNIGCGTTVCIGPIGGVVLPRLFAGPGNVIDIPANPMALAHLGGGPIDTAPLVYQGGPILHDPAIYNLYWAPVGYPMPAGFQASLDQMQQDLATASGATDNSYSVAREYYDHTAAVSNTMRFGGTAVDTDPFPISGCQSGSGECLNATQLTLELQQQIAAHQWPVGGTNAFYNVYLPPGINSCYDSSNQICSYSAYCAFHTSFNQAHIAGFIPWALLMDTTNRPGCQVGGYVGINSEPLNDILSVQDFVSHEQIESITDPAVGAGWINSHNSEIADMCEGDFGAAMGRTAEGWTYNQIINHHPYILQTEWANSANTCLQAASGTAPPPPVVTTTLPASTTTVTLPVITTTVSSVTVPISIPSTTVQSTSTTVSSTPVVSVPPPVTVPPIVRTPVSISTIPPISTTAASTTVPPSNITLLTIPPIPDPRLPTTTQVHPRRIITDAGRQVPAQRRWPWYALGAALAIVAGSFVQPRRRSRVSGINPR